MSETFFLNIFLNSLYDIENNYLNSKDKFAIWNLSYKGFLFDIFNQNSNKNDYFDQFSEKVDNILEARKKLNFGNVNISKPIEGKILAFHPNLTMYDEIAEQVSDGFFDSDDVPPPEFWLGIKDDILYSFIPNEFIERANRGVENSISGCLEWAERNV